MAEKTEISDGFLISDEVKNGYFRGIAGVNNFHVKEIN